MTNPEPRLLEKWFRNHARDLPWRRRRSRYRTLVSEYMLQQTQADRVAEYFPHFMKRFPSLATLASAREEDVLAAWQGLGYYRRARMLHAAARIIRQEHGGRIPSDVNVLVSLPGIGRYTAGAIAAIGCGRRVPAVDVNTRRVIHRLFGCDVSSVEQDAWQYATDLVLTAESPEVFTEGLIELGATICTRSSPSCSICPWKASCVALESGTPGSLPVTRPTSERKRIHFHAVVITRGKKICLEQRGDNGLWSRMWQVPTVESRRLLPWKNVHDRLSLPAINGQCIGAFTHLTSHREVVFHVYIASTRTQRGRWVDGDELVDVPIGAGHRKAIDMAQSFSTVSAS